MSRRGSNIYKRKDGRWEGRFKKPETGKYCSIYGKSYNEVREKLNERHKQTTVQINKCHLTVKELFELWLCNIKHKIKDSSYANYIMKLETYIYPALGALNFEILNSSHINEFINNLLKNGRKGSGGLSEKYVSDIIALLKSLGKFAQREFNFRNPMLYINSPKVKQKELTILSRSEQTILKEYLLKTPSEINAGVLLCLFTGIRLGELCALKWVDVDLNEKNMKISKTVQRTKSFDGKNATKLIITSPKSEKSVREIPLPDFLCEILQSFKKTNDCYVLSKNDEFIEPRLMQYHFKQIIKRTKLTSVNFHSLRHIFATNCIECGFDVKTLSEILGHSKVNITLNLYIHSSIERKRTCMDMLNSML